MPRWWQTPSPTMLAVGRNQTLIHLNSTIIQIIDRDVVFLMPAEAAKPARYLQSHVGERLVEEVVHGALSAIIRTRARPASDARHWYIARIGITRLQKTCTVECGNGQCRVRGRITGRIPDPCLSVFLATTTDGPRQQPLTVVSSQWLRHHTRMAQHSGKLLSGGRGYSGQRQPLVSDG